VRQRLLALAVVAACSAAIAALLLGTASARSGTAVTRSPSPARGGKTCPVPPRYREAFELASRETALPLPLLVAVARVESRVDQSARSGRGAHVFVASVCLDEREVADRERRVKTASYEDPHISAVMISAIVVSEKEAGTTFLLAVQRSNTFRPCSRILPFPSLPCAGICGGSYDQV